MPCDTDKCKCGPHPPDPPGAAAELSCGCAQSYTIKSEKATGSPGPDDATEPPAAAQPSGDRDDSSGSGSTVRRMRLEVEIRTEDLEAPRVALSMTSLVRWNLGRVLESDPNVDLKSAIETCQDKLEVEPYTGRYCMPRSIATACSRDRHMCCAMLAWQAKGERDFGKLVQFADKFKDEMNNGCQLHAHRGSGTGIYRARAMETYCCQKAGRGGYSGQKPNEASGSCAPCAAPAPAGLAGTAAQRRFYENLVGPVIKLPEDGSRWESEPPPCKATASCVLAAQAEKLDIPKCLEGRCMERLKELDAAMSSLRERAARLARRDAERRSMLERAEAAWEDMERGFQDRLQRLSEKEDEIAERMSKLVMERNDYKCRCTGGEEAGAQAQTLAEAARAQLSAATAELHAATTERDQRESLVAKLEKEANVERARAAKLQRELTVSEEQAWRRHALLTEELAAQRTLTRDVQFALQADLAALRDQFNTVADQLIRVDDENTLAKKRVESMKEKRVSMIAELNKCKDTCEQNFAADRKALIDKERELDKMKALVVECSCKVPKEKCCQVKRTPSLAAICSCKPEQSLKENCSCATFKVRMMSGLVRDLFSGLKREMVEGSDVMPCELLKCLADDHNWDKGSPLKGKLSEYFTRFVAEELDIAVATAVEHCHAHWAGESCMDSQPGTLDASRHGRGSSVSVRSSGRSAHESGCSAARAWRRTQADIYQLTVQLNDLTRESIRRKDLKLMEKNLTRIVSTVAESCRDAEIPSSDVYSFFWGDGTEVPVSNIIKDKTTLSLTNRKPAIKLKNSMPSTKLASPETKGTYENIIAKNRVNLPTFKNNDLLTNVLNGSPDSLMSRYSNLLNSVSLDGEVMSNENIVYVHRVDTTVDRNQEKLTLDDSLISIGSINRNQLCSCDSNCHCFNKQPVHIDVDELVKEMLQSRREKIEKNGIVNDEKDTMGLDGDGPKFNKEEPQKDIYNELIRDCMRSCTTDKDMLEKEFENKSKLNQAMFTSDTNKIVNVLNTNNTIQMSCSCVKPTDCSSGGITANRDQGIKFSPDTANFNNASTNTNKGSGEQFTQKCTCSKNKSQSTFQASPQIMKETELQNTVTFQRNVGASCKCRKPSEKDGDDFTATVGKYISEVKSKICKSLTSLFIGGQNKCDCTKGLQTQEGNKDNDAQTSVKTCPGSRTSLKRKRSSKKSLAAHKSKSSITSSNKHKFHKYCAVETPHQNFCALDTPRNKTKYGVKPNKEQMEKYYLKKNPKKDIKSGRNTSKNKIKSKNLTTSLDVTNKMQNSVKKECICDKGDSTKNPTSTPNKMISTAITPKDCICVKKEKPSVSSKDNCICTGTQYETQALPSKHLNSSVEDQCRCENDKNAVSTKNKPKAKTLCSCESYLKLLNSNLEKSQDIVKKGNGAKFMDDLFRGGLAYGKQATKCTQSDGLSMKTEDTMTTDMNMAEKNQGKGKLDDGSHQNKSRESSIGNLKQDEIDKNQQGIHNQKKVSLSLDESPIGKLKKRDSTQNMSSAMNMLQKSKDGFVDTIKSLTQMISSRLNIATDDEGQQFIISPDNSREPIGKDAGNELQKKGTANQIKNPAEISAAMKFSSSNENKSAPSNQCVCCSTETKVKDPLVNELEVNAFQLLQKYVHCKMKKMKCACCPHDEAAFNEEDKFSKMLEKIQDVISADMKRLACHCKEQYDLEMNETMTFSLLEEYIRSKLNELKCTCASAGNGDNIDPCATTLANIKYVIDSDLADLSCCCKTDETECICVDLELANQTEKLDEDLDGFGVSQISHKNAKASRSTEHEKPSIEIKISIKTSTTEIEKELTIPNSSHSIGSNRAGKQRKSENRGLENSSQCSCSNKESRGNPARESKSITQKCIGQGTPSRCCEPIGQLTDSYSEGNSRANCGCSSSNRAGKDVGNPQYENEKNLVKFRERTGQEHKSPSPPYVGCTLDCTCSSKFEQCVCVKHMYQQGRTDYTKNVPSNSNRTATSSQETIENIAGFRLNNKIKPCSCEEHINNKEGDRENRRPSTESKGSSKYVPSSLLTDPNAGLTSCASNTKEPCHCTVQNTQESSEKVLQKSSVYSEKSQQKESSVRDSPIRSQYAEQKDPSLRESPTRSQNSREVTAREESPLRSPNVKGSLRQGSLILSQNSPERGSPRQESPLRSMFLKENVSSKSLAQGKEKTSRPSYDELARRGSSPCPKEKMGTSSEQRTSDAPCDCLTVPLCQVKLLVQDIEERLQTEKCLCETMKSTVCPVHGRVGSSLSPKECGLCGDRVEDRAAARNDTCSICKRTSSNLQITPGGSRICNLCNLVDKPN